MALIQDGKGPRVPRRKPPKVPVSKRKKVSTRRITYNVQAIQSQRGTTVRKGGDPQTDWMRWRQPRNAIMEMLKSSVREQLLGKGLKIEMVGPTEQAQYNPFSKTVNVRSGMGANEVRHELLHSGLALTPNLFPNVDIRSKFASSPLGTALGALNTRFMPALGQQYWAETAAISMGGAEAYPGYTPAYEPSQFSSFFNTQTDSWRRGWNIGR